MVGIIWGLREDIESFGVNPIRAPGNLKILDVVCTHHEDLKEGIRNSKSSVLKTESAASVSGVVRFDGGNFENPSGGPILSANFGCERGGNRECCKKHSRPLASHEISDLSLN